MGTAGGPCVESLRCPDGIEPPALLPPARTTKLSPPSAPPGLSTTRGTVTSLCSSLFSSGEIRYLTKMPGKLGTNILVVRDAAVELLDEQHLGSLWVVAVPPAIR